MASKHLEAMKTAKAENEQANLAMKKAKADKKEAMTAMNTDDKAAKKKAMADMNIAARSEKAAKKKEAKSKKAAALALSKLKFIIDRVFLLTCVDHIKLQKAKEGHKYPKTGGVPMTDKEWFESGSGLIERYEAILNALSE